MAAIVSIKNVVRATCAASRRSTCCTGSISRVRGGRIRRPDGAVGLGQDHAAEPDRRPRPADDGEIVVAGERIDQLSRRQLAKWRARNVGFVFQFYNLLPVLTAERNVELPLLLTKLSGKERQAQRRGRAWSSSGSPTARSTSPPSSRAASSSASRSRGRSCPTRSCSSATSPPAISTARRPMRPRACCSCSITSTARRSSWSRTIRVPRATRRASSSSTKASSLTAPTEVAA